MTPRSLTILWVSGSALVVPALGVAQVVVNGRVVAAEDGQPLAEVQVAAVRARQTAVTDRFGRFALVLHDFPDTLVARLIGRTPEWLPMAGRPDTVVTLSLRAAAVPIASLLVDANSGSDVAGSSAIGTWLLPRSAVAMVPTPVEGDVFRSLVLSPAITYSSVLSAQPMLRGEDPGAVAYRLDGFTLLNPYHIGRFFGVLPPQAIQSVAVRAAPLLERAGDAPSSEIDAILRQGPDSLLGGAQVSLATATAWAGGTSGGQRWFVAARHAYIGDLPISALQQAPYRWTDVYARFNMQSTSGRTLALVTAFASHDDIHSTQADAGMRWGSRLIGIRIPLRTGTATTLETWAEASAADQDLERIEVRGSPSNVLNRFATIATGIEAVHTGERTEVNLGIESRFRGIVNRIAGGGLPLPPLDASGWGLGTWAGISRHWGRLHTHVGARVDLDSATTLLQPNARLTTDLGGRWSLGVAFGRSAKLYHTITNLAPEPDLIFLDVWRSAGVSGAPQLRTNHFAMDLKHRSVDGSLMLRGGIYAAKTRGVGEVTPGWDASAGPLRFGDARTYGFEFEGSTSGPRVSMGATYALGWSQRDWGNGTRAYVPWIHDRRHALRIFAVGLAGRGWGFSFLAETASPEPNTPIEALFISGPLTPSGIKRDTTAGGVTFVPGPENSARGIWTGHVDIGISKTFGSAMGVHGAVSLSVLNLAFSRVASYQPAFLSFGTGQSYAGTLVYRPKFVLPAVPTVSVTVEF